MKKKIYQIAPKLMEDQLPLCLISVEEYLPSTEIFASEKLSKEKLSAIPDVVKKLDAVKHGNAVAMWNYAVCYDCGISVARDQEVAKEYYMLAYCQAMADCESIDKEEKNMVVSNLLDVAQAYEEAAKQGYPCAMYFYGTAFLCGLGIRENDAEANFWFRKAADLGIADAIGALANSYFRGYGVAKDVPRALDLFKKAADSGSSHATLVLGQLCYNAGDTSLGMAYIKKAAAMGNSEAKKLLKQL